MQKLIPVDRWIKSNFSEISDLVSSCLSECVVDTKISDLPNIYGDGEKFPSPRVGQAVELLVRYKLFGVNDDLFGSINSGFRYLERFIEHYDIWTHTRYDCRYTRVELKVILNASRGYLFRLEQLLKAGDLTDGVIDLVLRLTSFINLGSYGSYEYFWDHCHLNFTDEVISNIRRMVDRSVSFLGSGINVSGGNLKLDGETAFCTKIYGGVVDFYGENCLVDLKCHRTLVFWEKDILRMIVYLLMARYSYNDKFTFGYLYNPRYDVLYKIDVSKIPSALVDLIENSW